MNARSLDRNRLPTVAARVLQRDVFQFENSRASFVESAEPTRPEPTLPEWSIIRTDRFFVKYSTSYRNVLL